MNDVDLIIILRACVLGMLIILAAEFFNFG